MAGKAEIWRTALRVIRDCGQEANPKATAFARSSELHSQGDLEGAARWAEIADAIDVILEDVADPAFLPKVLH